MLVIFKKLLKPKCGENGLRQFDTKLLNQTTILNSVVFLNISKVNHGLINY